MPWDPLEIVWSHVEGLGRRGEGEEIGWLLVLKDYAMSGPTGCALFNSNDKS